MAAFEVSTEVDTFEGMPETNPDKDLHRAGDFSDNSLASVQGFLAGAGTVSFHAGFFPATARAVESSTFSFVHIDVDIHRSVLDCCEIFFPRLERGGCIVFDDYGFLSCPGAKTAADSYFSGRLEQLIYLPTGQAFAIKL